jgi:YbbR domain-containing protein
MSPFKWFVRNLSTLLLAFALALVVWISAVTASNPNIDSTHEVPLEQVGMAPDMMVVGDVPDSVKVTLRAPTSLMETIDKSTNAIRAWVDLTGLEPGTHDLPVNTQINSAYSPVRRIQVVPDIVTITLEKLETRSFPVQLEVIGEPAIGYQKGKPIYTPETVTVSGPASLVDQIVEVKSSVNINGAVDTVQRNLPVQAYDKNGAIVGGVTITPATISVTVPIFIQGGYRNVIVKVLTEGTLANGYRLTNITVSPLSVVVFSTDPQLVNDLPGYVETMPVDLSGAEDDVDTFVQLDLPDGISVVGDQTVLVQVSIAAIEGSLTMTLQVVPVGLLPTKAAVISPQLVDVILSGPVSILDSLTAEDIRVSVDVTGLEIGTYQLEPQVDVLPERIMVDAINPQTVEVTIIDAPTPTPTPLGFISPTPTPTPTLKP